MYADLKLMHKQNRVRIYKNMKLYHSERCEKTTPDTGDLSRLTLSFDLKNSINNKDHDNRVFTQTIDVLNYNETKF